MQIGELAKRSGFSRDTLRYYEKFGLLPPEQFHMQNAKQNNYRDYKESALLRLEQIQQLKDIGFTLQEMLSLLGDLDSNDPCKNLPTVFREKIRKVDEKIALLESFRSHLQISLTACSTGCCENPNPSNHALPKCLTGVVQTYSPDD